MSSSPIRVESEIGRLRRVLVHRPGGEIDRMVPSMMEELLFDDILFGGRAREEHDLFAAVLRAAGAEVLDPQDLLAGILALADVRHELLDAMRDFHRLANPVLDRLHSLPPAALARVLVEGLLGESRPGSRGEEPLFLLPPLSNMFFQRDPQVVIGDHVIISAMTAAARWRESLIARTLFRYSPSLSGYRSLQEIGELAPSGPPLHLEGGDVLMARADLLLVGISERTNRRGVERLARVLRSVPSAIRHILLVELPSKRSYMHLDTVFTLVDRDTCLAYLPMVTPGSSDTAPVYRVDLRLDELAFTACSSLLGALADLGMPLDAVPCGGSRSRIDQQREQWTDGANAFAIAPGVILLYGRNERTLDELESRGWRSVPARDLAAGPAASTLDGRHVIALSGEELSRGRGGPRCMAMPLARDPI